MLQWIAGLVMLVCTLAVGGVFLAVIVNTSGPGDTLDPKRSSRPWVDPLLYTALATVFGGALCKAVEMLDLHWW